jgi:hypothetical protein
MRENDKLIKSLLDDSILYADIKRGIVYRVKTKYGRIVNREIGTHKRNNSYTLVAVNVNGKSMSFGCHRIIWIAANGIPPKDDLFVCHKDNNKSNNRIENLYLATHRNNILDAARDGLMRCKIRHDEYPKIKELFNSGTSVSELAKTYNLTWDGMYYIIRKIKGTVIGRRFRKKSIVKRKSNCIYHGTTYSPSINKWYARLMHNKKTHYLGLYKTEKDAAIAYDNAVIKIVGEESFLNFPKQVAG